MTEVCCERSFPLVSPRMSVKVRKQEKQGKYILTVTFSRNEGLLRDKDKSKLNWRKKSENKVNIIRILKEKKYFSSPV